MYEAQSCEKSHFSLYMHLYFNLHMCLQQIKDDKMPAKLTELCYSGASSFVSGIMGHSTP